MRRRRTGRERDAADLDGDGRLLARQQRADGARLAAVAREVLEQVADRLIPSVASPPAIRFPAGRSRRCRADGRGQRTGAPSSLARSGGSFEAKAVGAGVAGPAASPSPRALTARAGDGLCGALDRHGRQS